MNDDGLGGCRGTINGLLIVTPFWLLALAVAIWLVRRMAGA